MAKLEPIPGLHDEPYEEWMQGTTWINNTREFEIRVLGVGTREGTVSVCTTGNPVVEQEDLPVWTLYHHYTRVYGRIH